MMFVLNLGDGHEVETFDSAQDALHTFLVERENGFPLARLYSYGAGTFREYTNGNWYVVETGNLPNKVVEIHRRHPRPFLRTSQQSSEDPKP